MTPEPVYKWESGKKRKMREIICSNCKEKRLIYFSLKNSDLCTTCSKTKKKVNRQFSKFRNK